MEIKRYYAVSSSGPHTQKNKDYIFLDLENNFFSLYDSFGGSESESCNVEFLSDQVNNFFLKITEDRDATMPFYYDFNYSIEMNALVNSLTCGHRILLKKNQKLNMAQRLGSSGVLMSQADSHISLAFIGNVSGFLLRKGSLTSLYSANQSLNAGDVPGNHLKKNIPLSAFGMYYYLDYEMREVHLESGDRFILSSDGAISRLSENDLFQILSDQKKSLKDLISDLMSRNNSKGNLDNQSTIIVDY